MLGDQRHGDDRDGSQQWVAAPEEECDQRCHRRRDQSRERRVAQGVGDEQPDAERRQPEQRIEGEQDAGGSGDALAATEVQEDREQVAKEYGQRDQRDGTRTQAEARPVGLRQKDGEPTFGQIAEQGDDRRLLVATAQDIGRAGILRAVTAWIGQSEEAAADHGERHGAEQVGEDDGGNEEECVGHGGIPETRMAGRMNDSGRRSALESASVTDTRLAADFTLSEQPASWTSSLLTNFASRH